jgi:threonine/homoserine/homoserine lactone efflux protein
MQLELWIAFTIASGAFLTIPMGPTVMTVISYALSKGRSSAWATVPGVALGDFTAMTISVLGAGAILSASTVLFTTLKLFGAAYLVWLGIQLWRSEPSPKAVTGEKSTTQSRRMFWNSYIVTALNPQSIVFFIAFVPQFIDPTAPPVIQFAILEATFVSLAALNVAIWALLVDQIRFRFQRPSTLRMINRIGGGFLIGTGLLTIAARRAN